VAPVTTYFCQRRLAFPGAGSHQKTVLRNVCRCCLRVGNQFLFFFSFLQQGRLLSSLFPSIATDGQSGSTELYRLQSVDFHLKKTDITGQFAGPGIAVAV